MFTIFLIVCSTYSLNSFWSVEHKTSYIIIYLKTIRCRRFGCTYNTCIHINCSWIFPLYFQCCRRTTTVIRFAKRHNTWWVVKYVYSCYKVKAVNLSVYNRDISFHNTYNEINVSLSLFALVSRSRVPRFWKLTTLALLGCRVDRIAWVTSKAILAGGKKK